MSSAIGGSCPNNESVCFSPLLVAHVLIMDQYVSVRGGYSVRSCIL